MKHIRELQDQVEKVLVDFPETRNSDALLYVQLCSDINMMAMDMPFSLVFTHRKDFGLPNFESVGRARRKLQAENPGLRACKSVEEERYENFKRARDYAME